MVFCNFAYSMEQKFSNNSIDPQVLREFCEREVEAVAYYKGDQLEREGDPSRWFGYVTDGCFKYVTHGISDDREHITWFSFEGEFVVDYPTFLYDRPSQRQTNARGHPCAPAGHPCSKLPPHPHARKTRAAPEGQYCYC